MIVLDKRQLTLVGMRAFEEEMVFHLRAFSPALFRSAGEEQFRATIRLGVARAAAHGLSFRGPVRLYLDLMLLFGSYFDTDPQYPWVADILGAVGETDQMKRAGQLYESVRRYRSKVAGKDDVFTINALGNLRRIADAALPLSNANFVPTMMQLLTGAYPEKAAATGRAGMQVLINEGISAAKDGGLGTLRGAALMVVLMVAFGHGCVNDPLYPWIARTIRDPIIVDAEARVRRLESKALTWLDHVLRNFAGEMPP